jgi:hypothetical protein
VVGLPCPGRDPGAGGGDPGAGGGGGGAGAGGFGAALDAGAAGAAVVAAAVVVGAVVVEVVGVVDVVVLASEVVVRDADRFAATSPSASPPRHAVDATSAITANPVRTRMSTPPARCLPMHRHHRSFG